MSQTCKDCGQRPAGWERGPLAGRCEGCAKPIREAMRAGASKSRTRLHGGGVIGPVSAGVGLRSGFEAKARELVPVGRKLDKSIVRLSNHKKKGQPLEAEVRAALAQWRETCQKLASDVPA